MAVANKILRVHDGSFFCYTLPLLCVLHFCFSLFLADALRIAGVCSTISISGIICFSVFDIRFFFFCSLVGFALDSGTFRLYLSLHNSDSSDYLVAG